jgi:hypothetical protein
MQMPQEPVEILVEMDVNSFREFPEDGLAELRGYVGDYEVALCLPIKDKRVQGLKQQTKARGGSAKT